MSIPFPLCYFRMKKYDISLPKMLIIYLIVSTVGFIGARFGPSFVGIKDAGVRLYGLVLLDAIALVPLSKMMKVGIRDMGDFVAFNKVYEKYFISKPARSCVAVKTLPKGLLCEIEAIAVK